MTFRCVWEKGLFGKQLEFGKVRFVAVLKLFTVSWKLELWVDGLLEKLKGEPFWVLTEWILNGVWQRSLIWAVKKEKRKKKWRMIGTEISIQMIKKTQRTELKLQWKCAENYGIWNRKETYLRRKFLCPVVRYPNASLLPTTLHSPDILAPFNDSSTPFSTLQLLGVQVVRVPPLSLLTNFSKYNFIFVPFLPLWQTPRLKRPIKDQKGPRYHAPYLIALHNQI